MEDKIGTRAVTELRFRGWVSSAPYDLLFLANIAWPLLLVPGISTDNDTVVDFWQVYFLTLPHRWITLLLVAIDPDRRADRGYLLASLTVLSAFLVVGAYLETGVFLCLGFIDYIWNGWHFASQHAGLLRIYTRKSGGGNAWLERWGLRGFILYTIVRTSSSILWRLELYPELASIVSSVDLAVLAIPVAVFLLNIRGWKLERLPKMIYLTSVTLLYSGYLLASHFQQSRFILCFATAASMFHAVEYLAIVSHYASRREHIGSVGLMKRMAPQWILYLTVFLVSMGTLGVWISVPSRGLEVTWQGLNLWAAFTHYAFDGVIWKLRRPETAKALGAMN